MNLSTLRRDRVVRYSLDVAGEAPRGAGVIYLLWAVGTPFMKIGYSTALRRRFLDLRAANPLELMLCEWTFGTEEEEQRAHRALSGYRVRGEWYSIENEERRVRLIAAFREHASRGEGSKFLEAWRGSTH